MLAVRWHALVAAGAGVLVMGSIASAQPTTSEGAALVVFPRVVADGSWDTTIQLSNIANRPAYVRCHYVNGALTIPGIPPGPGNPPLWVVESFPLAFPRRQPTHWVVSRGRSLDPVLEECEVESENCDGTGLDPGRVPAVPDGFTGELVCVEVDASGAPWSGNALIGQATLTHVDSGEVVIYPAVGLHGLETNDADNVLCLGGEADIGCPRGAEYRACPNEWIMSHPADFDDRSVDRSASSTTLTVVSCGQNFDTLDPPSTRLQFRMITEMELQFSATFQFSCWGEFALSDISPVFMRDTLGTDWIQTRIRASQRGGVMIVQQTVRQHVRPPAFTAVAAVPPHDGVQVDSDRLVLPSEVEP